MTVYKTFVKREEYLDKGLLRLIEVLTPYGIFVASHMVFRLHYIPVQFRRYLDIICISDAENIQQVVFFCKANASITYEPSMEIPQETCPRHFFTALMNNFEIDATFSSYKEHKLILRRKILGPVPLPDRFILTYLEPHVVECKGQRLLLFRLESYRAFYFFHAAPAPAGSPSPVLKSSSRASSSHSSR